MKNKNLLALLIVFVLTVVVLFLFRNYQKGTIRQELKDFAVKDTASITKIFLADKKGNKIKLTKKAPGQWMVNDKFTARKDAISTLLFTIHSIEVDAPVSKAAYNNVLKEMATTGTKVEIYSANNLSKTYYVGGTTPDYLGTYMMLDNSSTPFSMHIPGFEGFLTTRYFTEEHLWRSTGVFNYTPNEIKTVKVEYPQKPELSFQINSIGNNQFSLLALNSNTSIQNFDTMAVKEYLLNFKNINYEGIEVKMRKELKDSIRSLDPLHIISVTDNSGKVNSIKTYPKKPQEGETDEQGKPLVYDRDRMYGQLNNEEHLVLIQYFVFDKVLKPITYFQKRQVVKK